MLEAECEKSKLFQIGSEINNLSSLKTPAPS